MENLIGKDKIPEPWNGFELDYIPEQYIINDEEDDRWVYQFDTSPEKRDPENLELIKKEKQKSNKEYQEFQKKY